MNKVIITGISILVLIVAGMFFFKGGITGNATIHQITLGYCPTMKQVAKQIENNNEGIVLIQQPSSAQAIQELNNENIDIALIGRKAGKKEIQPTNERMLETGYTLVSNTKRFVQESELTNIKVNTAIAKDIAKEILPDSDLVFYSTTQDAVANGLSEAVLIDWDDYKDNYELVVVMRDSDKVIDFRLPVLYSSKYDLENINVETLMGE